MKYLWGKNRATTSRELEQEIQGLVDQGEAQGLLTAHEGEMIEAVLELDETTVGQIMVPRTELACIPREADFAEMIKVVVESGHSRLPVYSEDLDHIVGVIHAKDLLLFWGRAPQDMELDKVLRKPYFVPQAMKVDELLTAFKRRRVHLAVVVDEYGGTAGVVTMEDVLEEIVGEIEDEYDQEESMLSSREDGSFLVDARMEVEDLSDHLGGGASRGTARGALRDGGRVRHHSSGPGPGGGRGGALGRSEHEGHFGRGPQGKPAIGQKQERAGRRFRPGGVNHFPPVR